MTIDAVVRTFGIVAVSMMTSTCGGKEVTAETETGEGEVCPELVWTDGDLEIVSVDQAMGLPKYTSIQGSLRILGVAGLEDLSFLECLESIDGNLAIFDNPDLDSLLGLERLRSVAPGHGDGSQVAVSHNQRLRSLEGLSSLAHADAINIEDNPMLESLEGFSGLESAEWISILGNDSLTTVGLRSLKVVGKIQIGYGACASAEAEPEPIGNAGLTEFDGLDSLEEYGRVRIGGNPNLVSVAGLASALVGSEGGTIWIELNPQLPYAEVQAVADALEGSYNAFKSCSNLDEGETCVCNGVDGLL